MKPMTVAGLATLMLAATAARGANAAENWIQSCASCHGQDGAGKTKIGHKVGAKDLADAAYQKSFTDAQLFDHLKAGETDADGKSKMKPFGDKLSDDEIKALVGYVRALSK